MTTKSLKTNFTKKNDYYPIERFVIDGMAWRERALEIIPEIRERIDNLKGMIYPGYGFHYTFYNDIDETERQIKGLSKNTEWVFFTVAQVRLEGLIKELVRAESQAKTPEEYWRDYDFTG